MNIAKTGVSFLRQCVRASHDLPLYPLGSTVARDSYEVYAPTVAEFRDELLSAGTLKSKIDWAIYSFYVKQMRYRQYGLLMDDIIDFRLPITEEAVERLPMKERMERDYRIGIAHYLIMKNEILPKDQWTTDETDRHYLYPIFREVEASRREARHWKYFF